MGNASVVQAIVFECRGEPGVLDRAAVPADLVWVRLRPGRALAIDPSERDQAVVDRVTLESAEDLFVVDVSTGWTAIRLSDGAAERLAELSPMWVDGVRDGPLAGLVAGIASVVVPQGDDVLILAGASYEHHLAELLEAEGSAISTVGVSL